MTKVFDPNRLTFLVVCVMLLPTLCRAHGVKHRVFPGGTCIEASYDDGSPMAFCDVTISAPDDREHAYQMGTTDPHGRFAFTPDTNGNWRLTVDDGMGHLVAADVQAGPDGRVTGAADTHIGRLTGAIVGISVIFGLFGSYCLARQRFVHARRDAGTGEGGRGCTLPKA